MALRAASQLKPLLQNTSLQGRSTFASHQLKQYATTPDHLMNPAPDFKAKLKRGDFLSVGIAIGMVAVATSLGLYTALHQLHSAPNVHVKKSRRETIPEVVEAERVAEEAERFVTKSFFRKVAHLKTDSTTPIRGTN